MFDWLFDYNELVKRIDYLEDEISSSKRELRRWEYGQRGMQPLDYWKPIDIEAYDELRSSSGSYAGHFDATSERNRQQPLLFKEIM